MAIFKEIRQDDGVITTYHRITAISKTINSHNSIFVMSYTDKTARNMEKEFGRPYKSAITYETKYDDNMTAEDTYEYIKTLNNKEVTSSNLCSGINSSVIYILGNLSLL